MRLKMFFGGCEKKHNGCAYLKKVLGFSFGEGPKGMVYKILSSPKDEIALISRTARTLI